MHDKNYESSGGGGGSGNGGGYGNDYIDVEYSVEQEANAKNWGFYDGAQADDWARDEGYLSFEDYCAKVKDEITGEGDENFDYEAEQEAKERVDTEIIAGWEDQMHD